MASDAKVDPSHTHFQVLALDENATIVRRQIEEAYDKRTTQAVQRLKKIDPDSEEAATLNARIAQLNAAKAVLIRRKSREAYKEKLQQLRDAERDLAEAQSKGKRDDTSAVLVLHLRQQVERTREELQALHEEHYRRHAHDHDESRRAESDETDEDEGEDQMRRRVRRVGERAAALAALAAQRPVKRVP